MRIFILATAATEGGALSILKDYLSLVHEDGNDYTICVNENIKGTIQEGRNFSFIFVDTKSWVKRLTFDFFKIKTLINQHDCDVCINFQNIPVKTNAIQIVYVHQPIPFSNVQFPLNSLDNIKLWLYKIFYGKMINFNKSYAEHFIVQTEWMKNALCEQNIAKCSNISIIRPEVSILQSVIKKPSEYVCDNIFFYPAARYSYKNHTIVIKAMGLLGSRFLQENSVKVVFTLNASEVPELIQEAKLLGVEDFIEYTGQLTREEVMRLYSDSKALVFPSRLETFGMPLAEAAMFNIPIIVSDELYSKEVLNGYKYAVYCDSLDSTEWANAIKHVLTIKCEESQVEFKVKSKWSDVYAIINNLLSD
ncbi:glycosyltransferase [Hafnia paralvei]|uniref:D-inositol 3-phosphate glycosyltransferase n=2 Tax=Hafnia TaxID=568 RepID=A0A172WZZ2_HAFAL|nr:glycosyltransferase [Hafnia paralvei]ANF29937.1 D-inositol 3-phosphate glycosyltransferase [Hafnia alvei]TBM21852.1 glycosyltransferase [Hafnia paralvei]